MPPKFGSHRARSEFGAYRALTEFGSHSAQPELGVTVRSLNLGLTERGLNLGVIVRSPNLGQGAGRTVDTDPARSAAAGLVAGSRARKGSSGRLHHVAGGMDLSV